METKQHETIHMEDRAIPWKKWSAGPSIADSGQANGAINLREEEVIY